MESDYSDEEYAPISLNGWGDQSQRADGSTNTNQPASTESAGWGQLVDPTSKVLPGALGSGGLHRQGKNYKPIDEECILKQRLKGGGLPKTNNEKKTRGNDHNKKGKRPTDKAKTMTKRTTFSNPTTSSYSTPKRTPKPEAPPPLSSIRRPPPSGNTGWGGPLVETPFWEKEQKKSMDNTQRASTSWSTGKLNDKVGFDSKKSSQPMAPPPGFGNIPQRQYPVATKPQPPPPPGFSYAAPPNQPAKRQSNDQPKADEGWGQANTSEGWGQADLNGGWGQANTNGGPANTNEGWGQANTNGDQANMNGGWGQANTNGGWGQANTKGSQANTNGGWGGGGSGKSKWATTTPIEFVEEQTNALKSGRFSDPCKTKYSAPSEQGQPPLPKNYYRKDGVSRPAFMETPTKIAAPPPSHNPIVVSIHLELENGSKVPIAIRKLDDPNTLARAFCQGQNIVNPTLINGITQLFAQQQSVAMQRYKQ